MKEIRAGSSGFGGPRDLGRRRGAGGVGAIDTEAPVSDADRFKRFRANKKKRDELGIQKQDSDEKERSFKPRSFARNTTKQPTSETA